MIRTRDFLLFTIALVFLITGIAGTIVREHDSKAVPVGAAPAFSSTGDEATYSAEVREESLDRSARVASLRAKIEAMGADVIRAIDPTPEPTEETDVPKDAEGNEIEVATASASIDLCGHYAPRAIDWPAREICTAERDGYRIVYREVVGSVAATTSVQEEILVQLPIRSQPLSQTSCIPTDVVGIALDGSLIRNGDHQLYSIFGSETLIGYALDGFPIYGTTSGISTDECGGAVVGASYRYLLSPERPGVLGCFAGTPASI